MDTTEIQVAVTVVRTFGLDRDAESTEIVFCAARQQFFDLRAVGGKINEDAADAIARALVECEHRGPHADQGAVDTVTRAAMSLANGPVRRLDTILETDRDSVSAARTTIHQALDHVEKHGWGNDLTHDTVLATVASKYLATMDDRTRSQAGETIINEITEALHVAAEWPDEITHGQIHLIWSSALAYEIHLKRIEHRLAADAAMSQMPSV